MILKVKNHVKLREMRVLKGRIGIRRIIKMMEMKEDRGIK